MDNKNVEHKSLILTVSFYLAFMIYVSKRALLTTIFVFFMDYKNVKHKSLLLTIYLYLALTVYTSKRALLTAIFPFSLIDVAVRICVGLGYAEDAIDAIRPCPL